MANQPDKTGMHLRVEHDLTLHPPQSDEVNQTLDSLREGAKLFAHLVIDATPLSREQSLAITNIEQALQWAIAAIVRNQ